MEEKENIVRKKRKRLLDYKTTIGQLKDEMVAKDRVLVEIRKKLDWCESLNQELKEIIQTERTQYSKEKEKLCKEIMENKKSIAALQVTASAPYPMRNSSSYLSPLSSQTNVHTRFIDDIAALQTENQQLRRLVERGDLKQHDLCIRFLRMKRAKDEIYQKLLDVDEDYISTLRSFLDKITTIRCNNDNRKYEQLMESNAKLVHENISLKIDLQCLRRDIDSGLYEAKLNLTDVPEKPRMLRSKSLDSFSSRSNF